MLGFLLLPIAAMLVGIKHVIKALRRAHANPHRLEARDKNKRTNKRIADCKPVNNAIEDKIHDRIVRKEAYDDVRFKCRQKTADREMPCLSMDEIDAILNELKIADKKR